jgi:hypothetical protein
MTAPEPCSVSKAGEVFSLAEAKKQALLRADTKKNPGRVFGPGTFRQFQFHECTDLRAGVKRHQQACAENAVRVEAGSIQNFSSTSEGSRPAGSHP